ncbi:MAG TPA: endonuclease/exonuclease/phosphatase family protein [Vicinamibacteria bacterium]|nr:endonuclease/exonuclease/phosphatase family protein [Vicinamibacteria bacterium]
MRLATYNIRHGQTGAACTSGTVVAGRPPSADCGLDLSASIAVMRALDAHVIAVQEVDRGWARSDYVDQPAALAAGLGMTHQCYAANLDHPPDAHSAVRHQYGTLILSRFPILGCGIAALRRTGDNEQRGLTRAVVDVFGVRLQVFHTHLHTTAADRVLQSADVAGALDSAPAGPKVLMGDLNAGPDAAEMQPLVERLRDAWTVAPTADNPSGFTAPARLAVNPTRRIDYVLVSPDFQVSRAWVPIDARTRLASDHYPVVAEVTLRSAASTAGASPACPP